MTLNRQDLPPVRISYEQAKRWEATKGGFADVPHNGEPPPFPTANYEPDELETDPSIEQLVYLYKVYQQFEHHALSVKKEIAARLMEHRYISITKLAEELGVSRPTLYAWQKEAAGEAD